MASFLKWLFARKRDNEEEEPEPVPASLPGTTATREEKESELINDKALRVLVGMMLFGFLAVLCVSLWVSIIHKVSTFWSILGLAGVIGLAASVVGGFLGFLFGIPRSLQKSDGTEITVKDRKYSNNTNLEQISDWLTKIIVGVGLTQIPSIERRYDALVRSVSKGFDDAIAPAFAYPFASGLMIFFSICGFLAVYIWAKVYFLKQLVILDKDLDKDLITAAVENVSMQTTKIERNNIKIELNQLNNILTDFNRRKNRILEYETQPEYKELLEIAKPNPIKYIEDVQKERWGGSPEANGYLLEAEFSKGIDNVDENCNVRLIVKPVSPETELKGPVYFFLHDSFYSDYIRKVEAHNNTAEVSFPSFEAFTAAAVFNRGKDKLELDMNTVQSCPTNYHYSGDLLTVDDIQTSIKKLEEQKQQSS